MSCIEARYGVSGILHSYIYAHSMCLLSSSSYPTSASEKELKLAVMQGKTGFLGLLRVWLFALVFLPATLILALLVLSSGASPMNKKSVSRLQVPMGTLDGIAFAPFESLHGWAQFAPFSPVDRYQTPPEDCIITQVNDTSFTFRFV
jgi:hypothetical protein